MPAFRPACNRRDREGSDPLPQARGCPWRSPEWPRLQPVLTGTFPAIAKWQISLPYQPCRGRGMAGGEDVRQEKCFIPPHWLDWALRPWSCASRPPRESMSNERAFSAGREGHDRILSPPSFHPRMIRRQGGCRPFAFGTRGTVYFDDHAQESWLQGFNLQMP